MSNEKRYIEDEINADPLGGCRAILTVILYLALMTLVIAIACIFVSH